MTSSHYLIALGSNQRHAAIGSPRSIIAEAIARLKRSDLVVEAVSPIIGSRPVGPSSRRYANAAIIARTDLDPAELLGLLKSTEAEFGPRRGQDWSRRVLDLDIILWGGGLWSSDRPALTIPHPLMRERSFVLGPAAAIAPDWRDPVTGLRLTHLRHRLNRFRSS
ncbi:2-amino-4-hydroxy-6-hydroxymethyldihydropteridinediphosphokinase [Parasphingorhabdus marina DSM 22363]|uniref:2-amino-4-hydroxy-6-hydroxymethyldihydropteridine pyrophosphokinase n=1 Tax=Parasphingorhabdus marina DSM 22363 TaxID=1123272 RepID=A0A1N6EIP3_9SPHN|nr:2-amino-4-hydroxy-6-hydroxymethyldihydropteridine diphosphokinase [Parasphingorhabdus marina]SIN82847.1 2-amino-4-hydroxy-6-hydroxymethyldihydropteridinediphosphokinase [Parasphingorhabdus marina DSM 22363]